MHPHPTLAHRQLVFPMDTTVPDYLGAVDLVVEKLASIEGRSAQSVLKACWKLAMTPSRSKSMLRGRRTSRFRWHLSVRCPREHNKCCLPRFVRS